MSSIPGVIPFLFSYVTCIMALGCSWTQIRQAMKMRYAILLVLLFAHVIAPLIAYFFLSQFFFPFFSGEEDRDDTYCYQHQFREKRYNGEIEQRYNYASHYIV
jgi:ACR3 family arsenite efflux pump ArsB